MLPSTSLIIPTRNRAALLRDTVRSILEGEEVPEELVVVDQSDERNEELASRGEVRGCAVRYVWEPGEGVSRARNTGMRLARGEVLVFTDDDVLVEPAWFGTIVRAVRAAGPRSAITGRVWPMAPPGGGGYVPSTKTDPDAAAYEGRIGADVFFGGNMAFYRAAAEEVGGFDERLHRAQDNDYGFRLLEAGYRILYHPDAAVHHRAWRSDRGYLRHRWHYGLGQGAYYAKHLSLRDRYMLRRLATDVGARVRTLPYLLVHRRRKAYGNAAFALGVLAGVARWFFGLSSRPGAPPSSPEPDGI